MEEYRTLNISPSKSGRGSISYRLLLPKKWLDDMNVNNEERTVLAKFSNNKITIEKISENNETIDMEIDNEKSFSDIPKNIEEKFVKIDSIFFENNSISIDIYKLDFSFKMGLNIIEKGYYASYNSKRYVSDFLLFPKTKILYFLDNDFDLKNNSKEYFETFFKKEISKLEIRNIIERKENLEEVKNIAIKVCNKYYCKEDCKEDDIEIWCLSIDSLPDSEENPNFWKDIDDKVNDTNFYKKANILTNEDYYLKDYFSEYVYELINMAVNELIFDYKQG